MAATKLSLGEYLSTVSMSERSAWAVKLVLKQDAREKRSEKEWDAIMKNKCSKITYTKIKAVKGKVETEKKQD